MSLINQMLKDLAKRSKTAPTPEVILKGLSTQTYLTQKTHKNTFLFITVMFILILISTYLLTQLQSLNLQKDISYPSKMILKPLASENISKNNLLSNTDNVASVLDKSTVSGMTIQVQKEITSLRILLDKPLLYRIGSNRKDQMIIVLENTNLLTNLPQIDTLNSAIKTLHTLKLADGSLMLILTLNTDVVLELVNLNEENNLTDLQINLYQKDNDKTNTFSQNELIDENQKTPVKKFSYDATMADEYQEAMNLSKQGFEHEAITKLSTMLIKYPEFSLARKTLASLLLKEGNILEAELAINAGLKYEPQYPAFVQLKAQILVEKGDIVTALNLLEKDPPPIEENPDYHALIAAIYMRQNKHNLAEKLYERLVSLQPENAIWWMGLGIAEENLNKNKNALSAYSRANENNNLNPELKVFVEKRIDSLMLS